MPTLRGAFDRPDTIAGAITQLKGRGYTDLETYAPAPFAEVDDAVIEKPREYYVIDRLSPGTPVFDASGNWLGIGVYKMVSGKPTQVVTLPAEDVLEIAEQVRKRTE